MGVEIQDLGLTSTDEYSIEIQLEGGGPGSSQRRLNPFRGAHDLSGGLPPSNGSGTLGMVIGGDTWYVSIAGSIDIGDGSQSFPVNTMIIAKFAGAANATDFLWQG